MYGCMMMYGCMDVWMYGCMDVWMYDDVWMYGCMDVWMYGCMYVCMYIYICIYYVVCRFADIHTYLSSHLSIYLSIYLSWSIYMYIYLFTYTYINFRACIYIYIHTDTIDSIHHWKSARPASVWFLDAHLSRTQMGRAFNTWLWEGFSPSLRARPLTWDIVAGGKNSAGPESSRLKVEQWSKNVHQVPICCVIMNWRLSMVTLLAPRQLLILKNLLHLLVRWCCRAPPQYRITF